MGDASPHGPKAHVLDLSLAGCGTFGGFLCSQSMKQRQAGNPTPSSDCPGGVWGDSERERAL